MGNFRIDPKKQFSKKLARWTAWFWFLYMIWLSLILLLEPRSALYSVYMGIIATIVMVINVYSYCKNSIAEKMIFGLLDKTKIELNIGKQSTEEGKDADESEVSNG